MKLFDTSLINKNDSILDILYWKGTVLKLLIKYKARRISVIKISKELNDICLKICKEKKRN